MLDIINKAPFSEYSELRVSQTECPAEYFCNHTYLSCPLTESTVISVNTIFQYICTVNYYYSVHLYSQLLFFVTKIFGNNWY